METNVKELFETAKQIAFDIVLLYKSLTEQSTNKELLLSKQLLLTGTKIGDHIQREEYLEAYYSAKSAKYWLDILYKGEYIGTLIYNLYCCEFDPMTENLYSLSHPTKM